MERRLFLGTLGGAAFSGAASARSAFEMPAQRPGAPTFAARASAEAAEITADASHIDVVLPASRQSARPIPMGVARYARVPFDRIGHAPRPAWFRSADRLLPDGSVDQQLGGYWLLAEREIDPIFFGATGEPDGDDTAAIQAAIDFAIYGCAGSYVGSRAERNPAQVVFSTGHRITDTIHLGYGTDFTHVRLRGTGDQFYSGIFADFHDRPAFNVQGGRTVEIDGVSIIGRNEAWLRGFNKTFSRKSREFVSNYLGPNLGPTSLSRHAPYAGIAVDAYSGERKPAKRIAAISRAAPGVVSVRSHGFSTNEIVFFSGVGGMTELNDRHFRVQVLDRDQFTLLPWDDENAPVDTTGFGAFTFGGSVATPFYPDVSYPSFLGPVDQYRKKFSSRVTIRNCRIAGFAVAVVTQPCNADGNGDYVSVSDCQLRDNIIGLGIGNSQARLSNTVNNCYQHAWAALDTVSFGKQQGQANAIFAGHDFTQCYQILNVNMATTRTLVVRDCYGESLYRIGRIGGNTSLLHPTRFEGCALGFNHQYFGGEYAPTSLIDCAAWQPVSFSSCLFNVASVGFFVIGSEQCTLDDCTIRSGDHTFEADIAGKIAKSASLGIWDHVKTGHRRMRVGVVRASPTYDFSGVAYAGEHSTIDCDLIDVRDFNDAPIPYWARRIGSGGTGVALEPSFYRNSGGNLSAITRSGRQYSLIMAAEGLTAATIPPGSICLSSIGQIFYVKAADFHPDQVALALVQLTHIQRMSGKWSVKPGSELVNSDLTFWNAGKFYPATVPLFVETVEGSAELTLRTIGDYAKPAEAAGTLSKGDCYDGAAKQGVGFACNSLRTSVFSSGTVERLEADRAVVTLSCPARFTGRFEYPVFVKGSYDTKRSAPRWNDE